MSHKIKNLKELIVLANRQGIRWTKDPSAHHTALGYLMDLSTKILKKMYIELNTIHNINQPLRYWEIVLTPWLMQFLAVMYDRYVLANELINDISCIECRAPRTLFITPRTTYESLKLTETEQFNNQILTDILLILGEGEKISDSPKKSLNFETVPNFNNERNYSKQIFNNLSKLLTTKNSIVASYSSIPYQLQFKLVKTVKNLRPIFPYIDGVENYDYSVNLDLRQKQFIEQKPKTTFENIALLTLFKYIPICYIEGYQKLQLLAKRYGQPPKVIIVGTEMYSRYESYMHYVGRSAIKGTKIVSMQHGGNYGMELRSEKTLLEINPYDKFYSWGWSWNQYGRAEASEIKPMPATFLSNIKQSNVSDYQKSDILLTVTSIRKTIRRMDCSLMNPYNNEKYFNEQLKFYRYLNGINKGKVKIRLYKDDLGNLYKEKWLQKFPEIKFDSNLKFQQSLQNSKLYVTDHLSTTWLEAVTINKPTILFISKDLYDYTPEFKELMEKLKLVSIYHDSANSAANFINKTYPNIDSWWLSKNVQSVISDLRKTLAYVPNDWLEKWSDELNKLARLSNR